MNRTLTKKFIYVIAALTLLAMLIPAMAIPVSAAGEALTMTVNGVNDGPPPGGQFPGEAFNASGSIVTITANFTPTSWALENVTSVFDNNVNYAPAQWYPNNTAPSPTATTVMVQGTWGEARIRAYFNGGSVAVTKKWGMLCDTTIGGPMTYYVTWNESAKAFAASGNVTDYVCGDFVVNGQHVEMPMQNMTLNWYLLSADKAIDMTPDLPANLNAKFGDTTQYSRAQYVQFVNTGYNPWNHSGWAGTTKQTFSGADGKSDVRFAAWFEENIQVVVVPQYPTDPNRFVIPEVTSVNFATSEYEAVPQVRWAGEKIVLEANFGKGSSTRQVKFYLQNQSVGTLEGITSNTLTQGSQAQTVWVNAGSSGLASVILTSNVAGEADVVAALYPALGAEEMTNQESFKVYFLSFFSLTLRDVNGKRSMHNAGDWTVANPYSTNFPAPATSDLLTQTANVSQDTLERAQVRGYFLPPVQTQGSSRTATGIDLNADGVIDINDVTIGGGYWVLPDDWQYIGGYMGWETKRPHWDIMDSPADIIKSINPLGPYVGETNPTVGPFAPGIETMTPTGWWAANPTVDAQRPYNTVVPNGALNAWDAPMPPAKVLFEITSGAGYFKDAYKTTIYYVMEGGVKKYTEPFYQILIPAHEAIPPFNNEFGGGYDWDSFDGTHGPYEFWKIINQPDAPSSTVGDAMHPTRVEVYSDNHGEAMVYLNGNYNLNLWTSSTATSLATNGAADIQPGYTVGTTVLHASADYPYIRTNPAIYSNTVAKIWIWGGIVLGPDATHIYAPQGQGLHYTGVSRMVLAAGETGTWHGNAPNQTAASSKKVIFVWVTDRDGKQGGVLGDQVAWTVTPGVGAACQIADYGTVIGINTYNEITQNIGLTHGFLTGTNGYLTGSMDGHQAVSKLIAPSMSTVLSTGTYSGKTALQALFYKFYNTAMDPMGLQPDNFAVAMIEVENLAGNSFSGADFNVNMKITGTDFGLTGGAYGRIAGVNVGTVSYNSNCAFSMEDPLDDAPAYGDANLDGSVNMGDVTTIERMILGLASANVNADANISNSIDMGDVVKVERQILGY